MITQPLYTLLGNLFNRGLTELMMGEHLLRVWYLLFSFLFLPLLHVPPQEIGPVTRLQWYRKPCLHHSQKLLPSCPAHPSQGQTETFPKDIWSHERKQPCWTGTVLKKHSQMEKQGLGAINSCYTHQQQKTLLSASFSPLFLSTKWTG